jgi:hypothetical protein
LDQRKLGTKELHAVALQDGGQAADKEAGGNQDGDFALVQAGGRSDDQRNRDDAAVHGEHVLEAISEGSPGGQPLILRPLWFNMVFHSTGCFHEHDFLVSHEGLV